MQEEQNNQELPEVVNQFQESQGENLITVEQMIASAKESIINEVVPDMETFEQNFESYKAIKLNSVNDLTIYNNAKDGVKKMKKIQKKLEESRIKYTSRAIEYQKGVKAEIDQVKAKFDEPINHLEAEIINFEKAEKVRKDNIITERTQALVERKFALVGGLLVLSIHSINTENLADMSEDEYSFFIKQGDMEVARLAAEEKRRNDQIKELQDERDKIAAERKDIEKLSETLKAEIEELRRLKQEILAQATAVEETYIDNESAPVETEATAEVDVPEPTEEDPGTSTAQETIVNPMIAPEVNQEEVNDFFNDTPEREQNEFTRGYNEALDDMSALINSGATLKKSLLNEFLKNSRK